MRKDYKIKSISLNLENNKYIENILYLYRLKDFTKTINLIFDILRLNSNLDLRIKEEIAKRD